MVEIVLNTLGFRIFNLLSREAFFFFFFFLAILMKNMAGPSGVKVYWTPCGPEVVRRGVYVLFH